jgi:hypothetical protein
MGNLPYTTATATSTVPVGGRRSQSASMRPADGMLDTLVLAEGLLYLYLYGITHVHSSVEPSMSFHDELLKRERRRTCTTGRLDLLPVPECVPVRWHDLLYKYSTVPYVRTPYSGSLTPIISLYRQ